MADKNEVYAKYPWVQAYEALAQKLKSEYEKLTDEQKNEGDYSQIVEKVKRAFKSAQVDYFRDDWLFKESARKQLKLTGKNANELTKEDKKCLSKEIDELKRDENQRQTIAERTNKDIDPFSIFGFFNVDRVPKRLELAQDIMKEFGVEESIVTSFRFDDKTGAGIPVENYSHRIKNLEIENSEKNKRLWELFSAIVDWKPAEDEKTQKDLSDRILKIEKGQAKKGKGEEQIEKIKGFTNSRLYLFWVQPSKFLPLDSRSTAYLDFKGFEGLDADNLKTDVDAYLKKCAEKSNATSSFFVDLSQAAYEFSNVKGKAERLLKGNHNIVLHGAPGTGKTYMAKQIAEKLGAVFEQVQFHPSYDYTDFVEGLRPIQREGDTKGGEVGFELKDGTFKSFCEKALVELKKNSKEPRKYVFIIDEINRGDISKIFGELFFSIDPGYRGIQGAVLTQYANMVKEVNEFDKAIQDKASIDVENVAEDEKEKVVAARIMCGESNGKYKIKASGHFFVPENVYIIGTMNDIDRSVESMDFAFRRRFAWLEVVPQETVEMLDQKLVDWRMDEENSMADVAKERMRNLNRAICANPNLGSAYQIGPAYFLKLKDYKDEDDPLGALWEYHLEGLLRDYLRGTESDANAEKDRLDELHKSYDPSFEPKGKRGRKKAGSQNGNSDEDDDSGAQS